MDKLGFVQLAEILDVLNNKKNFMALPVTHENFQKNWGQVNQFLMQLSAQLKTPTVSDEQKESMIRQLFSGNNQYSNTIKAAIELFDERSVWLHLEHHKNIMNLPQKVNLKSHPYRDVRDYVSKALFMDYDTMSDIEKRASETGYYESMATYNLTQEGERKLIEENARYERARNILPPQVEEQLLCKVVITSNPLENITNLMRLYANDPTLFVADSLQAEQDKIL